MNCSLFPFLNFQSKSVHIVSTIKSHVAVIHPKPKIRANITAHSAKNPHSSRSDFVLDELSVPQSVAFQMFAGRPCSISRQRMSSSTTAWPPIADTKSTNAPPYDPLNNIYNERYYSCPCQVHSRSIISIFCIETLFVTKARLLLEIFVISNEAAGLRPSSLIISDI